MERAAPVATIGSSMQRQSCHRHVRYVGIVKFDEKELVIPQHQPSLNFPRLEEEYFYCSSGADIDPPPSWHPQNRSPPRNVIQHHHIITYLPIYDPSLRVMLSIITVERPSPRSSSYLPTWCIGRAWDRSPAQPQGCQSFPFHVSSASLSAMVFNGLRRHSLVSVLSPRPHVNQGRRPLVVMASVYGAVSGFTL